MARHRFGEGRYRYFDHPLPDTIAELRGAFYRHLAPIANDWSRLLRGDDRTFPLEHEELLEQCRAAGQERPTPLILRYGEGDWNALHQDLYGDVYFPFQVLTVLSEPGVDFEGGEFVLMEQRPRAQSRAHVLKPPRGAFVIFPTRQRPNRGRNGYHRVGMRHGVGTVTRGRRTALGRHLPRCPLIDSVPSSQRQGTSVPVRCTPPIQRSTPLRATWSARPASTSRPVSVSRSGVS